MLHFFNGSVTKCYTFLMTKNNALIKGFGKSLQVQALRKFSFNLTRFLLFINND